MRLNSHQNFVIALLVIVFINLSSVGLHHVAVFADEGETSKSKSQPDAQVNVEKDRYAVPDQDVAALEQFINDIKNFRPSTADEFLEHRKRAPKAMRKAAEKIVALEKDVNSKVARKAHGLLLGFRVQEIPTSPREVQAETFRDLRSYLSNLDALTREELGLAFSAASALERSGAQELATQAYQTFGKMFQAQDDSSLVSYGEKMLGAARRTNLIGNQIEVTGQTFDGESFDWEQYRGKVVLIDFWATWCGPCLAELPNVMKNYERFRDRGFEVVGISLDTDRKRLERFLQDRKLPWVTLFEDGAGWEHPVAIHYGVMAIPTVILVDQAGKVVTLKARGAELSRHLEQLLPTPAESGDAE